MARAAAPAPGAPARSWRRPASPASSSSPMAPGRPALAGRPGGADFVHDPGIALHEDLWPDARAIGDGLGRAARMGGEEPARHLQGADHRRGCLKFADDRLPVPAIAMLPRAEWGRRIDPGCRRACPRLPAKLAPGSEQGPVYLIGTGESVETPMVTSPVIRFRGGDDNPLPRGEAGAFIAERNTAPGGKLPLNTNGGGLFLHAFRHVRHVRLAGERAPDARHRPRCHGVGGMFAASGTIVMSNEAP
jgi:hypothetical protein